MRRKVLGFKTILYILATAIVVCMAGYFITIRYFQTGPESTSIDPKRNQPNPQPASNNSPMFNKGLYSIDRADSQWIIVNKKRPLPADYVPTGLINYPLGGQLRPEAAKAIDSLLDSAKKDSVSFKIISAYRSFASQTSVYNGYVQTDGQTDADTYSARPGHSEHQTGLAADLGASNGNCDLNACFGETEVGTWLAAHAHEHGFIIRYQKGKDKITGYQYEPWHVRFVGIELASELAKTGQTMEEFFGLPAAPSY